MEIHDFADKLIKELSQRIDSLISALVKAPAAEHERMAGKIQALSDARSLIHQTRKTWAMRDHAHEEGL